MAFWERFVYSDAPASTWIVRLLVGLVFFLEGAKKFLFPDQWGAGRFVKIGLPIPGVLGPFVGAVEVIFGFMLIVGLLTRLSTIPLLIDISVAIATTKVPIYHKSGFWPAEAESRTDYCMLLGLLYLLIVGAGPASLDATWLRPPTIKIEP